MGRASDISVKSVYICERLKNRHLLRNKKCGSPGARLSGAEGGTGQRPIMAWRQGQLLLQRASEHEAGQPPRRFRPVPRKCILPRGHFLSVSISWVQGEVPRVRQGICPKECPGEVFPPASTCSPPVDGSVQQTSLCPGPRSVRDSPGDGKSPFLGQA